MTTERFSGGPVDSEPVSTPNASVLAPIETGAGIRPIPLPRYVPTAAPEAACPPASSASAAPHGDRTRRHLSHGQDPAPLPYTAAIDSPHLGDRPQEPEPADAWASTSPQQDRRAGRAQRDPHAEQRPSGQLCMAVRPAASAPGCLHRPTQDTLQRRRRGTGCSALRSRRVGARGSCFGAGHDRYDLRWATGRLTDEGDTDRVV